MQIAPVALAIRLAENAAELSHTWRGPRLAFANVNQICSNAMLPLNLDTLEFHKLVDRVRSEFLEMPGLRLTLPQAARLWGLDLVSCEAVVDTLIRSAFLQRTATGAVTRVDG